MSDITSANSIFTLTVPDVFAVPQLLQQYATDDAFATPEVVVAETVKGVDGKLSGAFVPFITSQTVTFQADSVSIGNTMEPWILAMQSAQTPYFASGTILLPSVGRLYRLTKGLLTRITPIAAAKKYLQPVSYEISWETWEGMPIP